MLAKSPVPGLVKTRLCPPLRPEQAAEVAEAALHDTLDAVRASDATEHVLALEGAIGPWLPAGFRVVPQRGATLAERLSAAWSDCGGPAVQIGMDTPQVSPTMLEDAMALLAVSGSVLGLAVDGGWWALGLHSPRSAAFDGVPMSQASTGRDQLRRLRELGLEPRLLPSLTDVDTWSDAVRVANESRHGRFATVVGRLEASRDPECGNVSGGGLR